MRVNSLFLENIDSAAESTSNTYNLIATSLSHKIYFIDRPADYYMKTIADQGINQLKKPKKYSPKDFSEKMDKNDVEKYYIKLIDELESYVDVTLGYERIFGTFLSVIIPLSLVLSIGVFAYLIDIFGSNVIYNYIN